MDVFELRNELIGRYHSYVASFIKIRDENIKSKVESSIEGGALWPEPLLQLNPSFEPGVSLDTLISEGILHSDCKAVFQINKDKAGQQPFPIQLHKHQEDAVRTAHKGRNYVLTTGTGSGKSLSYIIPIVNHVLKHGGKKGIKAIIIYPMNALANSQFEELKKFLSAGFPDGKGPVTFERYTGQEKEETRARILANPPDILLTNYVMLELILTRTEEKALISAANGLQFLVLDELHTYRGRQGADVAMLVRRVRDRLDAPKMRCIGTSATISSGGTFKDQQAEVARVASLIFGDTVTSDDVIGESLRRTTAESKEIDVAALTTRVTNSGSIELTTAELLRADPLAQWVEIFFGITREQDSGRLVRQSPRAISGPNGAGAELAKLTKLSNEQCEAAIRRVLMAGNSITLPSGFPMFAFRLHQFISRGDTAYASIEAPDERFITLAGQKYVPDGTRERVLLPLCFCRECGQEYYSIFLTGTGKDEKQEATPRELGERAKDGASGQAGFLFISNEVQTQEELEERLPTDWMDGEEVRRNRRDAVPILLSVGKDGSVGTSGTRAFFMKAPFRFCPHCGVSYDARQRSDFAKLSTLSSEGRSTATTILSLATVEFLRSKSSLRKDAQKLLSFTDNRQDASLQSGHFNDFVQVTILRAALYQAVSRAGDQGVTHEHLTQTVFQELNLPFHLYAVDPEVKFQAKADTEEALRDILGYRIYRDLERGWRITAPNLEQCGLLVIGYKSLTELCAEDGEWSKRHPALASASLETRAHVSKTLLDFMRRTLAIRVDYLERDYQERIRRRNNQRLKAPWGVDENERFQDATIVLPRRKTDQDTRWMTYLSPRGGMGNFLRRSDTFPAYGGKLKDEDVEAIIKDLLSTLRVAGLVEEVREKSNSNDVPGYQIPASAMVWRAGDGSQAFHDPIRVPQVSDSGLKTNAFFKELYQTLDRKLLDVSAHEHTAQVKDEDRQSREERFRSGELPILYCSPTMELGVDISSLNVVNMRNIPPTPANYAQRSGRAGRSGQPALVFSYCTTGSSHDQYFFKRPEQMVSGKVAPPRIELANEDLLRAHIQAVWLGESGESLGRSLGAVLDVIGDQPSLAVLSKMSDSLSNTRIIQKTRERCIRIINTIETELLRAYWYRPDWLDRTLDTLQRSFEMSCERWRSLYRAAIAERDSQHKITNDHSRSQEEREKAKRLREEAEAKIALLVDPANVVQSDFYSYRYFASEGFLPGYNFPRLPLSAFIPGRRVKTGQDSYLSRPRFLAISEFGPRATVYHEGSRYVINRVMLRHDQGQLATQSAKICSSCGYAHPCSGDIGPDLCVLCKTELPSPLRSMFRLDNVSTRRKDRISSDEEERLRLGYEIRTTLRFADRDGASRRTAKIIVEDKLLGELTYGDSASIWRINMGWARRAKDESMGFLLDTEKGYWESNSQEEDTDNDDPLGPKSQRVLPFVEDHKNCLIFAPNPKLELDQATMASLQSALKVAFQATYQLEDNELAVEALPDKEKRSALLFYESGEGGAGALRRVVEESAELSKVARAALDICHFAPDGSDLKRAKGTTEDCEAACYNCLYNYGNQMDHALLDRKKIGAFLLELTRAKVEVSPTQVSRSEHLETLHRFCTSTLEKAWLEFLETQGFRLPTRAQVLIDKCGTRPDFMYDEEFVAIYIDGPHHEYPERAARDEIQRKAMEDHGYTVITFTHQDDWDDIATLYPNIFGKGE